VSSALATQPEPAPVTQAAQPLLTNNVVLASAGIVLLLAPLAFGAVQPWAIFALEFCAVGVAVLWAARSFIRNELVIYDHPLYRPMAAFFAVALAQYIFGATAYRHVTYTSILLYTAYGLLVFVVTQTLQRSSHFEAMTQVVSIYGAAVAAFALLQGLAPNGKLYWIWGLEQGGLIYGPYVNHNHYAGLMELLLPFPLILAATRFSDGKGKITVAGIAALMGGSIFLSGSRGGMAAFVAEVIVLTVLLIRKRDSNWKQSMILGVFLVMVIVFLVWIGGNELTRRLASIHSDVREELGGGVRFSIDRDCLHMFLKRPLLGWGLGTFPTVYPGFRSFYTNFFVNEAHNDYLQLLTETGAAGFGITLWFLFLVFRNAAPKLKDWTESATGALTVAALLGVIGILVHSFVDFNLQIPANAALFYVLCAIAASAPLHESQRKRVLRRHRLAVQPEVRPTPTTP
jgi:O-antigen ligase